MLGFSGGGGSSRDGTFQGNATFQVPTMRMPVVVNAPYYGEQAGDSVQTLADGTHITRQTGPNQKAWRDSQGRVRTERGFVMGPTNMKGAPNLAEIFDPVSGYTYVLDDINKVAHRIKLDVPVQPRNGPSAAESAARLAQLRQSAGARPAAAATGGQGGGAVSGVMGGIISAAPAGAGPGAAMRRTVSAPEDLGMKTIDGVPVKGTRRTTVIPVGAEGNDGPITIVQETWYSPDLQLTVLTQNTDPRSGVQTTRIANLSRNEPDPALFFPPADYGLVDETASFTITWGKQQ